MARLLVACVREHDWGSAPPGLPGLLGGVEVGSIAGAANYHGIEACVYRSLKGALGIDSASLAALEGDYYAALQSHLRARHELTTVANVFAGARIPWLAMKGPVLAEVSYSRADLRAYGDLDLLVSPAHFAAALEALEHSGCRVIDRNWQLLASERKGQVHVELPLGTLADVHWNLFNDAPLRAAFAVDTDALLDTSRDVEVGDATVPTLGRAATLVHVALHACLAGGNRLLWLKDIEQVVLNDRASWPEIVAEAQGWSAGPPVAAMLVSAQRALGVPIDPGVVEQLAPDRTWRTMVAVSDSVASVARSTGRGSPARLVRRAARGDARSSFAELAHNAVAWVAHGASLDGPDPSDRDPASQTSLLHATDDRREAYLAAVVSGRIDR